MALGIIFSVIVSVIFAVYAVPRKYSKQNVILYTMYMGVAYFIGTIILISILWGLGIERPENLLNAWHLLTILRGFIWVIGMACYNLAIDKIGLTRFNQWKNIQGPVGGLLILFVIPLFVTAEISGMKMLWYVLGIIVMFASAFMFQIKTEKEKQNITTSKKQIKLGIILALISGVCFGVTALLNSIVSRVNIVGERFTFAQLFYHSLSLIVFSAVIYIITGNKTAKQKAEPVKERFKNLFKTDKKTWLPIIAGSMFMIATLLTIYAYRLITNPVAWSITQLNVLWTVAIGLFIFKEINYKQHWIRITLGVLMAITACGLLFLAL